MHAISLLRKYRHAKKTAILKESTNSSSDLERIVFFLKNSSLPILVVTNLGDSDKEILGGHPEEAENIGLLLKRLPEKVRVIINGDDRILRELQDKTTHFQCESFGFGEGTDFRASDIFTTQDPLPGTNFKINHEGKIVPVWLKGVFGKEEICAALSAAAVGSALGLNLVEISQALSEGDRKN